VRNPTHLPGGSDGNGQLTALVAVVLLSTLAVFTTGVALLALGAS